MLLDFILCIHYIAYIFCDGQGENMKKRKSMAFYCDLITEYYNFITFAAAGPLAPSTMSNETRPPSSRDLKPSA